MQSVEYYEIRNLMNNQEKQQLDSQINIITSKYDELHAELDADFLEWKKIWDMTLVTGSPSKTEPLAYYSTLNELMHKNYMLETQKNLASLPMRKQTIINVTSHYIIKYFSASTL